MNNYQQPHQASLWQKRNTFAKEIRRAKRNEIISNQRKKIFYQGHSMIMGQQKNGMMSTEDLIKMLNPGPDEEKVLNMLANRLQSANQNPRMIIQRIFNTGKYSYLLQNLNSGRYIPQTLSVFSIILARPDFQKSYFLVMKGFLEILFEIFGKHIEFAGRIANIIGNICVDSEDYCDWIFENHAHTLIFELFGKLYERFSENQSNYNPETELGMILWMVAIVCGTRESTLDFTSQYDDVIRFCIGLLEKRIFISRAIIIVYQLARKNPELVGASLAPVINQLIQEQTGTNKYFGDLLVLIQKISPTNIDYDILFQVVLYGDYEKAIGILRIIDHLGDSPVLEQLMKHQAWWQKILIKLQANTNETRFALSIIRKHKLHFPCVWRFIADYIDNKHQKSLMSEILVFLKISLDEAGKMPDKGHYMMEGIKTSKIEKKLQKLMDDETQTMVDKIQQVLFLMQNVSQQLKDKYELDVEI